MSDWWHHCSAHLCRVIAWGHLQLRQHPASSNHSLIEKTHKKHIYALCCTAKVMILLQILCRHSFHLLLESPPLSHSHPHILCCSLNCFVSFKPLNHHLRDKLEIPLVEKTKSEGRNLGWLYTKASNLIDTFLKVTVTGLPYIFLQLEMKVDFHCNTDLPTYFTTKDIAQKVIYIYIHIITSPLFTETSVEGFET